VLDATAPADYRPGMRRLIFLLLLLAPPVLAEVTEAEADHRVTLMANELKSPFCPGKTLMTCTSNQAYTLRKEMHEMVLQGMTDTEVVTMLKLRYGDEVQNPPQPWYTFFVPLLPYVFGGLLLAIMLRQWLRRGKREAAAAPPPAQVTGDDERLARLRARVASGDDD